MSLTCPACNKPAQTGPACTRCGCDVSRLQAVVEASAARLAAARRSLEERDWPEALAQAEHSWRLCHTVEAARLAFLAAAAAGSSADPLRWHAAGRAPA